MTINNSLYYCSIPSVVYPILYFVYQFPWGHIRLNPIGTLRPSLSSADIEHLLNRTEHFIQRSAVIGSHGRALEVYGKLCLFFWYTIYCLLTITSPDSGANSARYTFATQHSRNPNTKPAANTKATSSASCATSTATTSNNSANRKKQKTKSKDYDKQSPGPLRHQQQARTAMHHPGNAQRPLPHRHRNLNDRHPWRTGKSR